MMTLGLVMFGGIMAALAVAVGIVSAKAQDGLEQNETGVDHEWWHAG